MSASEAAKEAVYLRRLLGELYYSNGKPAVLYIDNQGAQKLASNPVYHKRSKHVDIRYHHIREVVKFKEFILNYFPTDKMISDILTKNLPRVKHNNCMNLMNMKYFNVKTHTR